MAYHGSIVQQRGAPEPRQWHEQACEHFGLKGSVRLCLVRAPVLESVCVHAHAHTCAITCAITCACACACVLACLRACTCACACVHVISIAESRWRKSACAPSVRSCERSQAGIMLHFGICVEGQEADVRAYVQAIKGTEGSENSGTSLNVPVRLMSRGGERAVSLEVCFCVCAN